MKGFTADEVQHLVFVAEADLKVVLDALNEGDKPECDRTGGVLAIGLGEEPCARLHVVIGEPPDNKVAKYWQLALEKLVRLRSMPHHVSSYQSRNTIVGLYGGAIRTSGGFIASFSGLPEHADEALCVLISGSFRNSWGNVDSEPIFDISGNEFGRTLFKELGI